MRAAPNPILNVSAFAPKSAKADAPAPEVETSLRPPAFANLTAEQIAIFEEIVALMPSHMHADADVISLAELARVLHRSQKCQVALDTKGLTVRHVMTNGSVRIKEAPAFRLQTQLFKQARRLMADLGISTATRSRLAPASTSRRTKTNGSRWAA